MPGQEMIFGGFVFVVVVVGVAIGFAIHNQGKDEDDDLEDRNRRKRDKSPRRRHMETALTGMISTKRAQVVHNDIINPVTDPTLTGDNTVFMEQDPIFTGEHLRMKAVNFQQFGTNVGINNGGSVAASQFGTAIVVPEDGTYKVECTITLQPINGTGGVADMPGPGTENVFIGAAYRSDPKDAVTPNQWEAVPGTAIVETLPSDGAIHIYTLACVGEVKLKRKAQIALQNFSYAGTTATRQDILLSPGLFTSGRLLPDLATLRVTRVA